MKVYEALAKAFAEEGTAAVFGLMGDRNQYWIEALVNLDIPVYEVRHEGAGLTMAEGWARVKGLPGVCTTTSGPGYTQLATALVAAARSHTPLVAFCGDTPWGNDDHNQRFNQEPFAAATECGFVRVSNPEAAYEAVQKAFLIARLEHRPVVLSAPEDVQDKPFDDSEEYVPSTSLISAALKYPDPTAMDKAAEIVASSERPIIIVGRGAIGSDAGKVVIALADRIGALVTTSLMAMNWLRDIEPFHAGISGLFATKAAMMLFQECDCLIAVGASLNLYTTVHGYLYPDAQFVQFDTRPLVVMGDGRVAHCYVQSDARVGLELLDGLLEQRGIRNRVGFRTPEVKAQLSKSVEDAAIFEIEEGTLDPREVSQVADEAIPENVSVVLGVGDQSNFPTMSFVRARPFSVVIKEFGTVGNGVPTAIGCVIANDNRPTVLMDGDAGFMMHLGEFETAVRYQLPLLVIVMNNEGFGAEYHSLLNANRNAELARVPTPDLGAVAVALGGNGKLVRTIDDLRGAIAEFVDSPGPYVADVRISPSVQGIPMRRRFGDDTI